MFWGDARLSTRLPGLIDKFDPKRLSSASYHLTVGPEIYVSPSGTVDENKSKTVLEKDEGFMIPAGQFGLILSEEEVTVPKNAIAFISIRAQYKFKGLVNVSGFHVDPGYRGRLIFSVYNAGSQSVPLARGEECFIIWYADVDSMCKREKSGIYFLSSHVIGPLARRRPSLDDLSARISQIEFKSNIVLAIAIAIFLFFLEVLAERFARYFGWHG